MGRLSFTSGYELIPEGTYDFHITEVDHDEVFGVVKITLECSEGILKQQWGYLDNDNTIKKTVMNLISYFAKNALNCFDKDDFDPMDLLNKWVTATVKHTQVESKKKPGTMNTFANISDFKVCENPPSAEFVAVPDDVDPEREMFS